MNVYEIICEKSSMPKTGTMFNKYERWTKAGEIVKARRASQIAGKLEQWKTKIGIWNKFLWVLGMLTAVEELVRSMYVAEELFAEGQIQTKEELEEYREFMWGRFVLTVLTPMIITRLKITAIVSWVARILLSMMTAAGTVVASPTGVGAAAGASALVAEQVFFTALQMFLQSPAATKFLAEYLFKPLVWLGTVPETLWEELRKAVTGSTAYQDAEKARAKTPAKPATPGQAPASSGTTVPGTQPALVVPAAPAAPDNRSYTDRELY